MKRLVASLITLALLVAPVGLFAQNVNQPILVPSTTGNAVTLTCAGGDSNCPVAITGSGTAGVQVGSSGTQIKQILLITTQLTSGWASAFVGLAPQQTTIFLSGVSVNDAVFMTPTQAGIPSTPGCFPSAGVNVVGTNNVKVTYLNMSTVTACTPAAGYYHFLVVRT